MDAKSLDEIHRFTASVDQPDLYTYLDIEPDAEKAAILHALQVRRSWAQGQQANPKYRNEALWVIKNIKLLSEALTTSAATYQSDVAARDEQEKLETLSIFIKGTLADGDLTARGEEAIQKQGELLGLAEGTVIRRVGEILAERDATQHTHDAADDNEPVLDLDDAQDLYEILDTPPDSDQETLERAYRERYRWARQLQDRSKSSRVYALLDEAWRVLKDPERRAEYDAERAEANGGNAEDEHEAIGLLPPPPPAKGLALPTPTVEKHLEQIEAGIEPNTPSIDMPIAAQQRDAPPPPIVPPKEATLDNDTAFPFENTLAGADLEEPDLSIDDDEGEEFVFRMPDPIDDRLAPMGLEADEKPESEGLSETEKALANLEGLPNSMGLADIQKMATMTDLDDGATDELNTQNENDANTFPAPDGLTDFGMGGGFSMDEPISRVEEPPASVEPLPEEDEATDEAYLSAGQLFNDDAVLQVDSPKTIRIRTGSNPFPVRITVLNAGEGQMPGKVSTNVDWVQLSPKTLDPNRARQVVEALVEPDAMPGNSAKAIVTIDTEHGETRTVTIDALKHVVSPLMMFVSALSLIGLVGVFLGLYFSGIIGSDVSTPDRTILAINVDPPAGEVYINDRLVGNQGTLSLVDTFPINTPFQVRVELDGFEPFLREVTVPLGTQFRLEADLILRDSVDFQATEEMTRSVIDQNALDTALEQRQHAINACFTRNLRTMTPFQADIEITSVVTARGAIEGIQFGDANFRSPAVEICLRRQIRAIQLPLLAGDYAEFTRTFSAEIRPASAINEDDQ